MRSRHNEHTMELQQPRHYQLQSEPIGIGPTGQTVPSRQPEDEVIAYRVITSYYVDDGTHDFSVARQSILNHLDLLRAAYPDLHEVHGKRILDVACGARNYCGNQANDPDRSSSLRFDPWMSRLLLSLGAHPVGLDICRQIHEQFTSYQVDLTRKDALSFLPANSFDAFYVSGFPTTPAIKQFLSDGRTWPEVRDDILSHLHRSLKESGKVIRPFTEKTERFVASHLDLLKPLTCNDDDL